MGMRDLSKVIDQMLDYVPENHLLVDQLESVQDSVKFSAPEQMKLRWTITAEILHGHISATTEIDWKLSVINVWMDG